VLHDATGWSIRPVVSQAEPTRVNKELIARTRTTHI
jgi:hypothetical protein